MRIGMILDEEYPHPRVRNEAINLILGGNEVVLFSLCYNKLPKEEIIEGIKLVRFKTSWLVRKFSALAYSTFIYRCILQRKIKEFIYEYKPDAIHVHNIRIGKAVIIASKSFKGELILDLHENIPEIMKMYHHVTHFPGILLIFPSRWKKWERILVEKFDKIIVVADEAKDSLITEYGTKSEKIIIVPNSVQPSFYLTPSIYPEIVNRFKDKFAIFYYGDTGLRRGLETAIKSINQLRVKIPEICLIIVGKSKSDSYLKKIVSNLEIEPYVFFEGFKDDKLLQSYITASAVCISPLLRNIHHDTTFANKIFQYMALGRPLVVSDCPAQERIIQEANSGLVHKAGDVNSLSEKIYTLFKDIKMREEFGKNGASFIKKEYNQILKSKDLLEYYCSLQ